MRRRNLAVDGYRPIRRHQLDYPGVGASHLCLFGIRSSFSFRLPERSIDQSINHALFFSQGVIDAGVLQAKATDISNF
jgi:hypothetical protein